MAAYSDYISCFNFSSLLPTLHCSRMIPYVNRTVVVEKEPSKPYTIRRVSSSNTVTTTFTLAHTTGPDLYCFEKLRLTPSEQFKRGGAWHRSTQRVVDGFEAIFAFQINNAARLCKTVRALVTGTLLYERCMLTGSDGLAFVLRGGGPPTALGGGGALGLDEEDAAGEGAALVEVVRRGQRERGLAHARGADEREEALGVGAVLAARGGDELLPLDLPPDELEGEEGGEVVHRVLVRRVVDEAALRQPAAERHGVVRAGGKMVNSADFLDDGFSMPIIHCIFCEMMADMVTKVVDRDKWLLHMLQRYRSFGLGWRPRPVDFLRPAASHRHAINLLAG